MEFSEYQGVLEEIKAQIGELDSQMHIISGQIADSRLLSPEKVSMLIGTL